MNDRDGSDRRLQRESEKATTTQDDTIDLPNAHTSDPKSNELPPSTEPEVSPYDIGEPLGEGGMARVNLAIDRRLDRVVAIKRLRPEMADNLNARERFFDEAKIMAALDHPGAVPVYEAGQTPEGEHYYAMKRVKGQTLKDLLKQRTPEDIRSRSANAHFVDIFERVCQTVAAAHDDGLIHRDLKPENIMVDDLGVVYVMDWGLAKRLPRDEQPSDSQRTHLGAVMGTPAYMAPEQASGNSAISDRQTDVFSLGVMLYEILAGRNPFLAESANLSMRGVQFHDPDSPRKSNSFADRALSAVCMKALEKDPFRRYRSARELAADIRRFREHRPVSAVKQRMVDRLSNWARRRPTMAAVLATLAGIGIVGVLAMGAMASVETALVADSYEKIENLELQIDVNKEQTEDLLHQLHGTLSPGEKTVLEGQLLRLNAEREVMEAHRRNIAMAIVGFTIFYPEAKAQTIVRQSLLDDINHCLECGDQEKARASIQLALRIHQGRNVFGLSDREYETLKAQLAEVMKTIEQSQSP